MKERFSKIAEQTKKASSAIADKVTQASKIAMESAKTITITLLDQNGDGVVDQNDVKIMTDKGAEIAKEAAEEAKILVKEASKSELVKDATGGALIGAAIAVPVPVIGPVAGAAIGAAIGTYAHVTKGAGNSCNIITNEKSSVTKKAGGVKNKKPTDSKRKSTTKKSKGKAG